MPTWWRKSSSKELKKKTTKENFIDTLHKFIGSTEQKSNVRSGGTRTHTNDVTSEKGSRSRAESRSTSPSTKVSRCQSFADRPLAQPLPLPGLHAGVSRTSSGISIPKTTIQKRGKPQLHLPLPRPDHLPRKVDAVENNGDLATASASSNCSVDSDDPAESRLLSPAGNDFENDATKTNNRLHKDHSLTLSQKSSRDSIRPASSLFNNQNFSTSPKRGLLQNHQPNVQMPRHGAFASAPDSSMSSPSRSPRRGVFPEQIPTSVFWVTKPHRDVTLLGSGPCSSPGSGQTSGHNSMGGDTCGQLFLQHSRGSPEYSPIPSPRMTSTGPSSRIHSGAVSPLHPRAGGVAPESPTYRHDEAKKQSHRLPLPPISISNSPYGPNNMSSSASPLPRSPGRADNPTSPGPRWKKGKMIGHGTFGYVYVGFNSESGEMCAMKEVTLFSDDAKSRESAKQLVQEISLLSRLRHHNIVQCYGCDMIDDKLYIYLEYVSGGSIHKLLQEYGQFGELAIRSYTQQILSGLAYLHAKNTVHRDIKGANILVDPSGRVKLADFGMAKHITGQSCPLSFKGSPYWMAPEVIKNTNGCNLAVDIWSLGCTVLEMAAAKPPWSQYEGIAAMFKIGNSKELPPIPDHLSEEGKDFIRQCLRRDQSKRPTAAELLCHPFVRNIAATEKSIVSPGSLEPPLGVINGVNLKGHGLVRNLSSLDMEAIAINQLSTAKHSAHSSDWHSRNISCPVSPIGSPLLNSRSPQNGRMSPSPISSPRTTSGSSTPLTGGNGAIPFGQRRQLVHLHDGFTNTPRLASNIFNGVSSYLEPKIDLYRGVQHGSSAVWDHMIPDTNNHVPFARPMHGRLQDPYASPPLLSDHVSNQLSRDQVKINPSLDTKACSPMLSRISGV